MTIERESKSVREAKLNIQGINDSKSREMPLFRQEDLDLPKEKAEKGEAIEFKKDGQLSRHVTKNPHKNPHVT